MTSSHIENVLHGKRAHRKALSKLSGKALESIAYRHHEPNGIPVYHHNLWFIGPEIADYLHGSSRVCEGWGLDPIGELTIEPSPSSDKYPAGDLKNMFSKSEKMLSLLTLPYLGWILLTEIIKVQIIWNDEIVLIKVVLLLKGWTEDVIGVLKF